MMPFKSIRDISLTTKLEPTNCTNKMYFSKINKQTNGATCTLQCIHNQNNNFQTRATVNVNVKHKK